MHGADNMVYVAKYFAEFKAGMTDFALYIYQRDPAVIPTVKRMLNFTDLHVGYVGQNNPDDAIVKTELTFSLVDAPDMQYGANEKGGDWQEFYIQDPTLYKVELVEDPDNERIVRWTGYITPDSWSESLVYHGVITITARDNIGHLQDFNFADHFSGDTVTFAQVVSTAGTLIGQTFTFADSFNDMKLIYKPYDINMAMPAKDVVFFTKAFEGDSIYEALEKMLNIYALSLRWFDYNVFGICPIGYFTTDTFGDAIVRVPQSVTFFNCSGQHSLNPAYKSITDKITYEFNDDSTDLNLVPGPNGAPKGDPQWYAGKDDVDGMCVLFNQSNDKYWEGEVMLPNSTTFYFSIEVMGGYWIKQHGGSIIGIGEHLSYNAAAISARYALIWRPADGSPDLYMVDSTRAWQTAMYINPTTASSADANRGYTAFTINACTTPSSNGKLLVRIYSALGTDYATEDYFTCLKEFRVGYTLTSKTGKNTVTTNNDPLANLQLTRTSDVGQYVGSARIAQCVKNAMLGGTTSQVYGMVGLSKSADGTNIRYNNVWEYAHRQILCAYMTTSNVLEGELGADNPHFCDAFTYVFAGGLKTFFLSSGQLNVLTGRIDGAVLRELPSFEDVWPEYKMNAFTIVIESVKSDLDDGTEVAFDGSDIYVTLADPDTSSITIIGYVATPMDSWPRPWTQAHVDNNDVGVHTTHELTEYSATTRGGMFPFSITLDGNDLEGVEPERHSELTIGPCYERQYEEQGATWVDVATEGLTEINIYDYSDFNN